MTSQDLVAFFSARLDEDEAIAQAATPGPWEVDNENYAEAIRTLDEGDSVVSGGRWGGEAPVFGTDDALHIARHDPARVLADVTAKRAIIESFNRADVEAQRRGVLRASKAEGDDLAVLIVAGTLQSILLALAQQYTDHPDFDPAWRIALLALWTRPARPVDGDAACR